MVQKLYSKMRPVQYTNTHHDVANFVKHRMVKSTKKWISRERNTTFLSNKKILNLCLRWHILEIYSFVAEVTFKNSRPSCAPVTISAISHRNQMNNRVRDLVHLVHLHNFRENPMVFS